MSARRTLRIASFVIATIAAALFGYAIAYTQFRAPAWACGIFSSSNAASWVQGLGTLLAVVGAVGVAIWQRAKDSNDRRREKTIRARVVAYQIWPSVKGWKSNGVAFEPPTRGDELSNLAFLEKARNSLIFFVPQPIRDAVSDFHLFDAEGDHLLMATLIAEDGDRRLAHLNRRRNAYGDSLYETSADDEVQAVYSCAVKVANHLQAVGPSFLALLALSWGDHLSEDRIKQAANA